IFTLTIKEGFLPSYWSKRKGRTRFFIFLLIESWPDFLCFAAAGFPYEVIDWNLEHIIRMTKLLSSAILVFFVVLFTVQPRELVNEREVRG
ncbi:hypothetical protein ACJX0J_014591, partial [Zea mays]